MTEDQIRPHPVLTAYYASMGARERFVRGLFNSTAAEYDRINRVMSLGRGGWYRREALHRAGVRAGARVLDVAVGTGLVAREALRLCGTRGSVIGVDPSENMLAIAGSLGIPVVQGRAENLPIADASVDFVTMGYALRHVAHLRAAFAEFLRVLRPGGTLLILEIGRPDSSIGRRLARAYLGHVVPALCRPLRNGGQAGVLMRYFRDTIDHCVAHGVIIDALAQVGFEAPGCARSLGVFRAYTARRPAA